MRSAGVKRREPLPTNKRKTEDFQSDVLEALREVNSTLHQQGTVLSHLNALVLGDRHPQDKGVARHLRLVENAASRSRSGSWLWGAVVSAVVLALVITLLVLVPSAPTPSPNSLPASWRIAGTINGWKSSVVGGAQSASVTCPTVTTCYASNLGFRR